MNTNTAFIPGQLVQVVAPSKHLEGITYTVIRMAGDYVYLGGMSQPVHYTNVRVATPDEAANAKAIVTTRKRIRYIEETVQYTYVPTIPKVFASYVVDTRDIEGHQSCGDEFIVRVGLTQYPPTTE